MVLEVIQEFIAFYFTFSRIYSFDGFTSILRTGREIMIALKEKY